MEIEHNQIYYHFGNFSGPAQTYKNPGSRLTVWLSQVERDNCVCEDWTDWYCTLQS